ncbi:MAG TPA: CPCC family cysteine-rich protein [Cytophagaceae bacterium]|jgi:hypothetical protein|nr:CPCC family cysteine-rich protein [Cytophagaceae bacterium]
MYPERFDSSTLSSADQQLLLEFEERRMRMDHFLRQRGLRLFTCPSCGFPTLYDKAAFEYCDFCDWRDDGQDDPEADEVLQGSNGDISLTEHRIEFGYYIQELEHTLNGTLVSDPQEVIDILEKHKVRMDTFQENNSMNVEDDHPVWAAWQEEKNKIRLDLIKRKNS